MTPDERASAIAAKVARFFAGGKSWSWTTAGVTFTLSGFKLIPHGIEVVVAAHDASGPLPTTDSYKFINPPTRIVTGKTQVGTDPRTGHPIYQSITQSNPLVAAKQMVEETVLLVARRKGWGG